MIHVFFLVAGHSEYDFNNIPSTFGVISPVRRVAKREFLLSMSLFKRFF